MIKLNIFAVMLSLFLLQGAVHGMNPTRKKPIPEEIQCLLHFAAKNNNIGGMRKALESGANVNHQDCHATPLFWAVHHGNVQAIDLLVGAGADVNSQKKDFKTSLHLAACMDNAGVIRRLIRFGADVNLPDNEGSTPLHTAAFCNKLQAMAALLKGDISPEIVQDVRCRAWCTDDNVTAILDNWFLEGGLK